MIFRLKGAMEKSTQKTISLEIFLATKLNNILAKKLDKKVYHVCSSRDVTIMVMSLVLAKQVLCETLKFKTELVM